MGIQNSLRDWVTQPKDIAETLFESYQQLFTSSNLVIEEVALNHMEKSFTNEMNAMLMQEFTELEVEVALKQMAPLKAPAPNGMPPLFYQNFWSLVGDDVSKTILSMLNSATIPYPLNHTVITLIPKTKNPLATTDYCPISLCNVLYKLFSKVLANRVKKILPS